MRIRKHARVSATPISPSSTTSSTALCDFNPSPRDVLSEHPQSQLQHQVVIDYSSSCNGGGRDSGYAPDSLIDLKKQSSEEMVKKRKKEVKEDESRLSLVGSLKEKGKKRVNKVRREVGNRQCSRNDGKKWYCKNMAKEGYAYCEHHLTKRKSSNNHTKCPPRKSVKKAKAATTSPTEFYNNNHTTCPETKYPQTKCPQRSVKKAKAATTSPAEFYYYSGFGPWWGRKRGGSKIQRDELEVVDTADQATSSSSSLVHVEQHHDEYDHMPDYFDFDNGKSSEEEEEKMSKRRPRPIKARSLKSFL